MRYFRVIFHLDEIRRFQENSFKPFVAEYMQASHDVLLKLRQGRWIDDWFESVELSARQDGELLSRLSNDSDLYLFSNEVLKILDQSGIKGMQYLPVTVFTKAGSILSDYQKVANIANRGSCLDFEKSKYTVFTSELRPDRAGQVFTIEKCVLDAKKLCEIEWDVFRLEEQFLEVIVSERFVNLWRRHGFTNLEFEEVEVS